MIVERWCRWFKVHKLELLISSLFHKALDGATAGLEMD